MQQAKKMRRADYRAPEFNTDEVNLDFDIHEDHTICTSKVVYKRTTEGTQATELVLNAENPNGDKGAQKFLQSVSVNGQPMAYGLGYHYDEQNSQLKIFLDPSEAEAEIEIKTYLEPHNNVALEGLYKSDSCFVTQCESEGFRRITPFLDRPDVMAKYNVRVEADEATCPVLMANGDKVNEGKLTNGRHYAEFHDPWPKPCYLFATANGDLEAVEDVFVTKSGRNVNVRVYTEAGESQRGKHALEALKTSMKWDEDVFDCEYDLDNFNIVAVAKFNFGAMENKGLNVFRDSLILATPQTATDDSYQRIIDVVGHEYFHNYSGNRVTCRDWFNISLKEGLTVIREQMFTAFTTSDATQRIEAVQFLRRSQFPEDDGPNAHPVLPDEAASIENLYDATVYEKGAEIIRMMSELMGEEKFVEGVKHYFKAQDGKAVTIDEFVDSMEAVSGMDLRSQFYRWYTQSGRPRVTASGFYDPVAKTYALTLEQNNPPTKDQKTKQPLYIPVRMGLVDKDGNNMKLTLATDAKSSFNKEQGAEERVLHFTKDKQTFVFTGVEEQPEFHSLFRGLSALVDCDPGLTDDQLRQQVLTDPDGFNRWDAGQKLAMKEMVRLYNEYVSTGTMPAVSTDHLETLRTLVADEHTDPALVALAITPPSLKEFEASVKPVKPLALRAVLDHMKKTVGKELYSEFQDAFHRTHDGTSYSFDFESVGKRSLKGLAVSYMLANGGKEKLRAAKNLYTVSDNLTDQMIAMGALAQHDCKSRREVLKDFHDRFKDDQLVIQKWFGAKASSQTPDLLKELKTVSESEVFNWENPGHIGSLFGGFAANYAQFHRADGKGYEFIADTVIALNNKNPKTAARMVGFLSNWRDYDVENGKMMIAQLERIGAEPKISTDVLDKLTNTLPDENERKALGLDQKDDKPSGPSPS